MGKVSFQEITTQFVSTIDLIKKDIDDLFSKSHTHLNESILDSIETPFTNIQKTKLDKAIITDDTTIVPAANKLLYLDKDGKLPASITGSAADSDKVDGYHAGNALGQVPINNRTLNVGLNADLIDGYESGNNSGNIPISNGVVNTNLNADMLDNKHVDDTKLDNTTLWTAEKISSEMDIRLGSKLNETDNAMSASKLQTSRTISLSTDASGSVNFDGTSNVTIPVTLSNSGVTAGTYRSVTVDSKGRVTSGSNPTTLADYYITDAVKLSDVVTIATANKILRLNNDGKLVANIIGNVEGSSSSSAKLQTPRVITISGDANGSAAFDGSADSNISINLANSGVTAGTYTKVTVDSKGRVTTGSNPTTLNDYGITDAVRTSDVVTTATANKILKLDANAKLPTNITGNADGNAATATKLQTARTIAVNGDATGSTSFDGNSNSNLVITLSNSGVTAGTYKSITVDAKGRVTSGTNPTTLLEYGITDAVNSSDVVTSATANKILKLDVSGKLPTSITGNAATATKLANNRTISVSGDATGSSSFDGSSNSDISLTLTNSGVTAGTYKSITVDSKGRVTSGTNPTTLSEFGITDGCQQKFFSGGLSSDYVNFVIPLCSLDNTNINLDSYAVGDIVLKRNNGLTGLIAKISIACEKLYNSTTPVYLISKNNTQNVLIKPVTFVYNSIKYFGIHVEILSSNFSFGYFSGYSSDMNIINPIQTFNNNTLGVINNEIQSSLTYLTDSNNHLSYEFYKSPIFRPDGGSTYYKIWNETNDGSGSGLDADKLEGIHAGNNSDQIPISNGTLNSNLNADRVDGYDFDQGLKTVDSPAHVKMTLTQVTGTAPMTITSTTLVNNLNSDLHDGYHAGNASGQIPISNGTLNVNLNADKLDGNDASAFALSTHIHDDRYYTKTALESTTDGSSGAESIGAKAIPGLTGSTVQALLEALKVYADAIKQGLDPKDSVRVITTENITLSGLQVIDGVTLNQNDRVLVKNQTDASKNGLYNASSTAWTRTVDANTSTKVTTGMYCWVEEGSNADTGWILTTKGNIVLGTTELTFSIFSGAGQIIPGPGLSKNGNTLSLDISGVVSGTYKSVTVDSYGRITSGTNPTTLTEYGITDAVNSSDIVTTATANKILKLDTNAKLPASITGNAATATKLAAAKDISISGDATGTTSFDGNVSSNISLTLANSGVTAGSYTKVTVDAKGRVTSGSNPTTLSNYGITDAVNTSDVVTTAAPNKLLMLDVNGQLPASITGSASNSDKLDGLDATAFLQVCRSSIGSSGDFNTVLTEGEYSVGSTTSIVNAPYTGNIFGKLMVYVNDGGTHNNSSNWIWQYFNSTTGQIYMRYKVNAGTWYPWTKIWTENTMGSGSGLNADMTDGYHATINSQVSTIAVRDTNNNISATSFTGKLIGNADTATKLQTPRTINGVNFDGTSNITIVASANGGNADTIDNKHLIDLVQQDVDNKITLGSASWTIDNGETNVLGEIRSTAPGNSKLMICSDDGFVNMYVDGTVYVNDGTQQVATTDSIPTKVSQLSNDSGYITSSANISGNATTATKLTTARTINNVSFDGTSNIIIPSIYDESYNRIVNPGGGSYCSQVSSVSGAIAITLPVGMVNTMIKLTIKVYEYATNESFDIHCGGYTYSSNNSWENNPYAYIVGNPNIDRRFNVRFGYTAGCKPIIYIGETNSTWAYPQIFITEVQCGFRGQSINYTTGWGIDFATAFENITATVSNCQVGYATSTNTANAAVLRDGSGNFSAGTITASLSGNASTATKLQTGRTIALTGDITGVSGSFDGSANLSFATTLANSGVIAGTYENNSTSITPLIIDTKGRVTGTGAAVTITPAWSSITGKPTTLSGYGITDALLASAYTASDVLTKLKTVDGTGSGLDADTLDGHDSSYFVPTSNSSGHSFNYSASYTVPASMPESWFKVSTANNDIVYLEINSSYDNSQEKEHAVVTLFSYNMKHHITSTTSNYNTGHLLEIKTNNNGGTGSTEIWLRFGASTAAGTITIRSSHPIPTLVPDTPTFGGNGIASLLFDDTQRTDSSMLITRGIRIDGNEVWHAGNDGTGSGLDADTLDGYHATTASQVSSIAARDASGNISATSFTGSLKGNADTATKLGTSRTIALTGDVTGSGTFDGSANLSITTVVGDNSHTHTVSTISDLTATAAELNILDGITATTTELNFVDGVTSNIQNQINNKAPIDSPTFTGLLTAPKITTGTATDSYLQSRYIRGEGDATTYYHAIDFGYGGHDQVDFYEYGGVWNFHKHTGSAKDSGDTLVGSIQSTGWNGNVIGNVTGNASTATKLQTARTINGVSFDGTSNITITAAANGGNADTLDNYHSSNFEYKTTANTLRGNIGDPTVAEMALIHGEFNNKFRFIPPISQEESTDGSVWTTSTRATSTVLKDMMIGEGQGTDFLAIPISAVGGSGYYRLTWDTSVCGYVFLNALYVYCSTCANNVTFKIEKRRADNTTWYTVASGVTNNYPGHAYMPHDSIPFSTSTDGGHYDQVRLTFSITNATYANSFHLYGIEWFGGYPSGRRNVEYYDNAKNVTFPANITGTQLVSTIANGTAPLLITSKTLVTNLNADYLDGYQATTASQASTIAVSDSNNNISAASFTGSLKGNADTATKFATGRTISLTGDITGTSGTFDGSGNLSFATVLANTTVTPGTYKSVTVDAKGRITGGTNPNTLSGYGITDAATSTHNHTSLSTQNAALNMGGNKITNIADGNADTDAVSLSQVNTLINNATSGVSSTLHPPVADLAATKAITSSTLTDKELMNIESLGLYRWDAQSIATSDDNTVIRPTDISSEATAGRWIKMSSTINAHNNLDSIQGGSTGEYYHLTANQVTLVNNASQSGHTHTSANITDATNANTASMIVKRDTSGNFSAGTITAALSGNASTASKLQNARTFTFSGDATSTAVSFDGSANITIPLTLANTSVTPSTYTKVTVNAKGLITGGAALASSDVTTALGFTPYNATNPSGYITSSSLPTKLSQLTNDSNFITSSGAPVQSVNGSIGTVLISNLVSRGLVTAETNATRPAVSGLSLSEVYSNGYPTAYGNVITLSGSGKGEILIGWSGTSATDGVTPGLVADNYIRSQRDTTGTCWSPWAKIWTDQNLTKVSQLTNDSAFITSSSSISGNAATATKLQTARTINGVSFDGTSNITISASANGGNADTVDGCHSTAFATAAQGTKADAALPASSYTAADILAKLLTVDGASSGLDADTLDGLSASSFLKLTGGTMTGNIIFNNYQTTNPATYPSPQYGFIWNISTDSAGMKVYERGLDCLDYVFTMSDNVGSTDRYMWKETSWSGPHGDIEAMELYPGASLNVNEAMTVNGGLTLNAAKLAVTKRPYINTPTNNYGDVTIVRNNQDCADPNIGSSTLTMSVDVSGYTATTSLEYAIKIKNAASNPNTFCWSHGAISYDVTDTTKWVGNDIPVSTDWITLDNGIKIKFNAVTGGVASEMFGFRVLPEGALTVLSTKDSSFAGAVKIAGNYVWHAGNLTKVSQLANDSNFITSSGSISGNAGTATKLTTGRTITLTGDVTGTSGNFDGSSNLSFAVALSNSGVTAATYNSSATTITPFNVDAKGRITGTGAAVTITPAWSSITNKPNSLSGYGITDAATSTHTHTKSQITDMPTTLPANGGNSDTVDNKHATDFLSSDTNSEQVASVSVLKVQSTTSAQRFEIEFNETTGTLDFCFYNS